MRINASSMPESAEILRLALPLMSRYKIPVTPRNYAVWYEYAAGNNKQLNAKIDLLVASGSPVNSGVISSLYAEFIDANYELSQMEKAQKIFAELHENLSSALDKAFGVTSEYGDTLDNFQNRIKADLSMEQLDFLIRDMAQSTENMLTNNRKLMHDLDESHQESDVLREQLIEAKQQAATDTLTELPNRKAFFDQADKLQNNPEFSQLQHSLFLVDIDHFKNINDSYGHLFGDKVIKSIARLLKDQIKGKDFTARIGGEEFVVLLPETGIVGAMTVAENIRQKIERSRIINPLNNEIIRKVTVSIGVSVLNPADQLDMVLERADRALYMAKEQGRNQVINACNLPSPEQSPPSVVIRSLDEAR